MHLGHTIERVVSCRLVHRTTGLRRHEDSYLALGHGGRPTLKASVLEKVLIYLNRAAVHCLGHWASRWQGKLSTKDDAIIVHIRRTNQGCLFSECEPGWRNQNQILTNGMYLSVKEHDFYTPSRKRAGARLVECLLISCTRCSKGDCQIINNQTATSSRWRADRDRVKQGPLGI